MANFGSTKSRIDPRSIIGGALGFFEEGLERETSILSTVTATVASTAKDLLGGVYEETVDLSQTVILAKPESNGKGKFAINGSIDNFNKNNAQVELLQKQLEDKKQVDKKKVFFQALKEDQERAQRAKDKLLFEEEINDIVTNLPTEQKNQLLHYQAGYKDRSIYQRAELRRKLIEQQKQADKQEKEASIPTPAKQPSALEGAFEGRSGNQGGGTANLSAQAVG